MHVYISVQSSNLVTAQKAQVFVDLCSSDWMLDATFQLATAIQIDDPHSLSAPGYMLNTMNERYQHV